VKGSETVSNVTILIIIGVAMFAVIGFCTTWSNIYSLNSIKNKKVGDGQFGNARFATEKEIKKIYTLACTVSDRIGKHQEDESIPDTNE